jgi:ferredoxin--NADP+ reductase
MLCGNPEMVEDSRRILTERGFRLSRRGEPGHLAVENYW